MIQRVMLAPKDEVENIFTNEKSCKTVMAAMIDWSKTLIYDEDPEEDSGLEEPTLLTVQNTPQVFPSSPTLVLKKRRTGNSNWINETILEQCTKLFETNGNI